MCVCVCTNDNDSPVISIDNSKVLNFKLRDCLCGKRPLGRPRRRWEDTIRMNLKEIGINTKNWIDSAQNRDYWRVLVNAALNLRVL